MKARAVISFAAVDRDEDTGALSARSEHNIGNVAGSDARVGEFAFEHCTNLFGEGAGDSIAVIGSGSLFRHRAAFMQHSRITNPLHLPGRRTVDSPIQSRISTKESRI
jgi:hypothetical protein